MPSRFRLFVAASVAVALVAVPTVATATAPGPVPQPTAQQAAAAASTNPWLTLSAMTGNASSASAATAAAQNAAGPDLPPILPLAVILGTIALGVWILVHDGSNSGGDRGVRGPNGFGEAFFPGQQLAPVSPA